MIETGFYLVADSRYFLGAAAVLNSLRLHGHAEPAFVLDCGLSERQRQILEPHATLVDDPSRTPPWLAKTIAPLRHPARTTIMVDTDMVVTRSLEELVELAADGVVAFENDRPRHREEWGPALGAGPPRRQPYVSSGLVALGGPAGRAALEELDRHQRTIDFDRTLFGRADPDYEFLYPEQDMLNAILSTRFERSALRALERRLAPTPPFPGLRRDPSHPVSCAYPDGVRPFALHHIGRKPWLSPAYHGLFSRLFLASLRDPGAVVTVPERELPLRMRGGAPARAARAAVDLFDVTRRRVLGMAPR